MLYNKDEISALDLLLKTGIKNIMSTSVNRHSYVQTFFDFNDASTWIEKHMEEHPKKDGWVMEQFGINLVNHAYRAGISFRNIAGE